MRIICNYNQLVDYNFDTVLQDEIVKVLTAESVIDYLKPAAREDELLKKCILLNSLELEAVMSVKQWLTLPGLEVEYVDIEKNSLPLHVMKFSGKLELDVNKDLHLYDEWLKNNEFDIIDESDDKVTIINIHLVNPNPFFYYVLESNPQQITIEDPKLIDKLIEISKQDSFDHESHYKNYFLCNFFAHPTLIKFYMHAMKYAQVHNAKNVWKKV